LIDLTLTKISTFLVIVDKGGEVSHKDIERRREENANDMTLERDQLKLSTQVGGVSS
jgi:hypothetical protein